MRPGAACRHAGRCPTAFAGVDTRQRRLTHSTPRWAPAKRMGEDVERDGGCQWAVLVSPDTPALPPDADRRHSGHCPAASAGAAAR